MGSDILFYSAKDPNVFPNDITIINIIFNYQFTKRSDTSSAVAVNQVHGERAHIVRNADAL